MIDEARQQKGIGRQRVQEALHRVATANGVLPDDRKIVADETGAVRLNHQPVQR